MPKHIGNTGVESMAWAGRMKPFLGAQTTRRKGLEEYIEKRRSLFNTEKSLGLSTQRIMRTFFRNNLEKSGICLGYQAEEVTHHLTAQASSLKGQAFSPHKNMDIETSVGLDSPAQEQIPITQQIQPQKPPYNRETNRDLSLIPPAYTKTSHHVWKAIPTSGKTTAMSTNIQRREGPAEGTEPASTQVPTQKRSESHSLKNVEAIADKVYRFMQRDLILERERAN